LVNISSCIALEGVYGEKEEEEIEREKERERDFTMELTSKIAL
jgi:hypothetical protein